MSIPPLQVRHVLYQGLPTIQCAGADLSPDFGHFFAAPDFIIFAANTHLLRTFGPSSYTTAAMWRYEPRPRADFDSSPTISPTARYGALR